HERRVVREQTGGVVGDADLGQIRRADGVLLDGQLVGAPRTIVGYRQCVTRHHAPPRDLTEASIFRMSKVIKPAPAVHRAAARPPRRDRAPTARARPAARAVLRPPTRAAPAPRP